MGSSQEESGVCWIGVAMCPSAHGDQKTTPGAFSGFCCGNSGHFESGSLSLIGLGLVEQA